MLAAKVAKENNPTPVIAVQMNRYVLIKCVWFHCSRDKAFAFIEYSCTEDATSGLAFDGIMLQGNALKVIFDFIRNKINAGGYRSGGQEITNRVLKIVLQISFLILCRQTCKKAQINFLSV